MSCSNCGLVISCKPMEEYIDSINDKYKISCKSIYKRRYHIKNILNNLHFKQNIEIPFELRGKIYKIFDEIGKILPQINKKRKRTISIKFLLNKILILIGYDIEIFTAKSRKTLFVYERYWFDIVRLDGDKINLIIKSEN